MRKKKETRLDNVKRIAAMVCLAGAGAIVVGAYVLGFVREQLGKDHKAPPAKGTIVSVKGQTQLQLIHAEKKDGEGQPADAQAKKKE